MTLDFSGKLAIDQDVHRIRRIHHRFAFAVLILETPDQHWLLWRDSCHEREYRQLLVRLKREL